MSNEDITKNLKALYKQFAQTQYLNHQQRADDLIRYLRGENETWEPLHDPSFTDNQLFALTWAYLIEFYQELDIKDEIGYQLLSNANLLLRQHDRHFTVGNTLLACIASMQTIGYEIETNESYLGCTGTGFIFNIPYPTYLTGSVNHRRYR